MESIQAQLESKQFTLETMLKNVELFGGPTEVERKASILRQEIAQLKFKLDTLH